ncbi:hypothetical protein Gasu2_70170 [Galdieria sulphuraria]|uniref:Uncharacterized protein n=1 Tax=Galdieria sulphuraria TaxID=130081 RepID=M2W9I5_GALSU|nr:uncharacterized protein Gasu_03280 [Galdieria sulphuraria]EME32556.1 hypothetical protein Gasu_03280 [Galdieria sulphuraria]GJD12959.1 hypothetical protein Gasu2_70170 [Galdieria sulphuraria]|eukprot:XP_005709076.1 hypothetical protein Gasu_03280 [Galdieria sulphuraria]
MGKRFDYTKPYNGYIPPQQSRSTKVMTRVMGTVFWFFIMLRTKQDLPHRIRSHLEAKREEEEEKKALENEGAELF